MSIIGSNILAGASGQAGGGGAYEISRSVRLNAPDSAYLSRTPASSSNRKTWTWAGWVKRSAGSTDDELFSSDSSDGFVIRFVGSTSAIRVYSNSGGGLQLNLITSSVYRDPSAWYHLVISVDTTQASSSDRAKIYVNGAQVTAFSTAAYPSQNTDLLANQAIAHFIGKNAWGVSGFNGYLADIHFIDGQALDPTSFGEFDTNGVWQPIDYAGSFGTNGFHLPFSDNSTAAALGTDTSSNGNTWTVNNITPSDGTRYTYNIATMTNEKNDATDSLSHLFDGLLSTTCASINGTDGTITFSPAITGITSLRIHAQGKPGTGYFVVNGTEDYGNSIGDEVYQWITITGVSSLSTIFIRHVTGYSKTTVQAIEVNGVILTDGAAGDSLVDSPTNGSQVDTGAGGEVVGNYATLNPVKGSVAGAGGNTYVNFTLSNGNLEFNGNAADNAAQDGTISVSSGKWYWEVTHTNVDSQTESAGTYIRFNSGSPGEGRTSGVAYLKSGNKLINNSSSAYGASWTTNDVIGVALDLDANQITYYKNGASQGAISVTPSGLSTPHVLKTNGTGNLIGVANFGQRPFAYTAPSGFKALCTTNLPEPTIADGSTVMDVLLWSGNSTKPRTFSGLNFDPDLIWVKARSDTYNHWLQDSVRGFTTGKKLRPNGTDTEGTGEALDAYGYVSGSSSTGFTIDGTGTTSQLGQSNLSGQTYVGWIWDAGSSTVTNTAGSITSQVRANASAGFSVVTYTGTGANATVGHGLGVAPSMVIIKSRSFSQVWVVGHSSIGFGNYLLLNATDASAAGSNVFNSTAPTSTVFSLGTGTGGNQSAATYVSYCFAPVAGYSAMGSYVGNGSSDGSFVYTGFRSRWVMIKRYDGAGNWVLIDTARSSYNTTTQQLFPNSSDAEYSNSGEALDILSNGFKPRSGTSGHHNFSGYQYLYIAFAESPFQYARAR
jgi:hypothetical protein